MDSWKRLILGLVGCVMDVGLHAKWHNMRYRYGGKNV